MTHPSRISGGTEMQVGSAQDIYNLLLEGSTVRLQLPCLEEAKKLRNNIASIKSRQDKMGKEIGIYTDEDTSVFTTNFSTMEDGQPIVITMAFKEPEEYSKAKQFTYEIISSPSPSPSALPTTTPTNSKTEEQ